jgi:hypothetical protein
MNSDVDSEKFSPVAVARILGLIGVAGIVTGAFDIGFVQNKLVVAGDAAATLRNIVAHETLFRLGFSAHVLMLAINVVDEILSFVLMRRVNRIVAAISMGCGFVGIAIEGADMIAAYVPLKLAIAGGGFSGEHLQALAATALDVQQAGLLLSFVFYGIDEMAGGFLIFKSGFLPRILGIMLSLAGLCYFTHGLLTFLAPGLDAKLYPYILYPCAPGEGSIALWMAVMGVNLTKWRAWAAKPEGELAFG